MNDRELLELAAKAAGIHICHTWLSDEGRAWSSIWVKDKLTGANTTRLWNPLGNDGCALRLAVKLHMTVETFVGGCDVGYDDMKGGQGFLSQDDGPSGAIDDFEVTRRAIVRAAAEMGRVE